MLELAAARNRPRGPRPVRQIRRRRLRPKQGPQATSKNNANAMVAALPKGQGQAAKPGMLAAVKGVGPKANAAKGGTTQAKAGTPFVASKNLQHPGAKVGLGGVPNPQLAA